jgi:hypothetical protein
LRHLDEIAIHPAPSLDVPVRARSMEHEWSVSPAVQSSIGPE